LTLNANSRVVVSGDTLVGSQLLSGPQAGVRVSTSGGQTAGRIDTLVCSSDLVVEGDSPSVLLGGPVQILRVLTSAGGGAISEGQCVLNFASHRLSTVVFPGSSGASASSTLTMNHRRALLAVKGNLALTGAFTWRDGTVELVGDNRALVVRQSTAPAPNTQTNHRLLVHGGASVDIGDYQGALVATGGTGAVTLTPRTDSAACQAVGSIAMSLAVQRTNLPMVCVQNLLTRAGVTVPERIHPATAPVNCDVGGDARCVVFDR